MKFSCRILLNLPVLCENAIVQTLKISRLRIAAYSSATSEKKHSEL